jgi:Secretion system C-terminal sorting domain
MKIFLTIAIWLGSLMLLAQPVFEHTFSESAGICQLETLGEVYYSMDVINKQCLIYNMDHSLLKTIPLPCPAGYYLADIQYVSESLFNGDDLVELVYIYSQYVPTETSYFYRFESKVINENGSVLLSLPGVGFTQVYETVDQHRIFLAYKYDYSVIPYLTSTHVYSLPDQSTRSASQPIPSVGLANAYPNPATQELHIPVTLPGGVRSGFLELSDMNGKKVLSYPLTPSTSHVLLPTNQYAPGTYIYRVTTGQGKSEGKKVVIR